ncbi:MAG: DeoR/GlpR family DNA-binding transcription regulator [Cyclobacteriaceae bacterium]|nr:DeoR/GlpR family DNA-binding transcription regulator [Cyclobacteriaceae bacterium]
MNDSTTETIFQEERLDKILVLLDENKRLLTNVLADQLNTTSATIRKDLTILEDKGLLKRTHGGAVKTKSLYSGLALSEKEKIGIDEKRKLVKEAAKLISEGDTIILDSGSTTSLLAKEIKSLKGVTVITNAMNIASDLVHTNLEVILIGGSLLKETLTLVGPLADEMLKKISSGKLFMGVDGIDFEVGLTTPNILEANTTRVMMGISGEVILLTDSSKFGRRSLGVICQIDEIDKMITTKHLSENELNQCKESNVEVIIV